MQNQEPTSPSSASSGPSPARSKLKPVKPSTKFKAKRSSDCTFKCSVCPKKFPTIQALGGHQNAHRSDKAVPLLQMYAHSPISPQFGLGLWLGPTQDVWPVNWYPPQVMVGARAGPQVNDNNVDQSGSSSAHEELDLTLHL